MRGIAAALTIGALAALGCGGWLPASAERAPPGAVEPWAVDIEAALPDDLGCEHGPSWWLVAGRDPSARRVVALERLRACTIDGLDERAALAIADGDRAVVGAGLRLAGDLLATELPAEARGRVLDAVGGALTRHADAAVRFEAIEALDRAPCAGDPAVEALMLAALHAESPELVAELLQRVTLRAAGLASPKPWVSAAHFTARAHLDPGIRGRAGALLARLAPSEAATVQLLREQLRDPHPHARAAAAMSLAEVRDLSSASALVALLEDERSDLWVMRPWSSTDGRERRLVLGVSRHERVDAAVLEALAAMTADLGERAFVLRPINPKYLKLDLISARRDAVRWLDESQGALPPPPE